MFRKIIFIAIALIGLVNINARAQFTAGQVLTAADLNAALASPNITGGSINGAPVGNTNAAPGTFTTLSVSGVATLNGLSVTNAPAFSVPLGVASGGTGVSTSTGSGSVVLSNAPLLTSPSISGGAINSAPIGASTASTGAFTTLSSSQLSTFYGITTPSTGNFYEGQGASISRINDRLFIGGATSNNGTQVASQPDWLTQFQISTGRTGGFIQLASLAALNGVNPQNNNAFVTATQSRYMNYAGGVIGALAIGVNNNTNYATNAWGGYNEAYRMAATTGGAYGLELDTVNYAGDTTTDPYQQASGQVVALQLAAGAELPSTGQYPSQAAINIQNNHSTFDSGIVFGSNSLTSGLAIAFSSGQRMQWFGNAATPTSSIVGTGTTQAAGIQQIFSDNQVQWQNGSGQPMLTATNTAGAVNGVTIGSATTGNWPSINATGSDTNAYLTVSGKGTGGVNIAGATDGSSPGAGYVGQVVSQPFSSVSLSASATPQNLTSLLLPAGDWYVEGYVTYSTGTGATMTVWQSGLNTASTAALPALGNYFQMQGSIAASGAASAIAPVSRQNVTTSTTVYLVGQATFSGGSVTATGYIRATRRP